MLDRSPRFACLFLTLLIGMSVLLLVGCAGQDQRLLLEYRPERAAKAPGSQVVAVATPGAAHGLGADKYGQTIVGEVPSKGGRHIANILATNSLVDWVADALVLELKAEGVNAGRNLDAKPGRPVIRTEITQVRNEVKSQWSSTAVESTIALDFKIEKDGQEVGSLQNVVGKAQVESAHKLTDNTKDAMEKALRDALHKAAPRLAQVAGR